MKHQFVICMSCSNNFLEFEFQLLMLRFLIFAFIICSISRRLFGYYLCRSNSPFDSSDRFHIDNDSIFWTITHTDSKSLAAHCFAIEIIFHQGYPSHVTGCNDLLTNPQTHDWSSDPHVQNIIISKDAFLQQKHHGW